MLRARKACSHEYSLVVLLSLDRNILEYEQSHHITRAVFIDLSVVLVLVPCPRCFQRINTIRPVVRTAILHQVPSFQ